MRNLTEREDAIGRRARGKIVVAVNATRGALDRAKELGVDVIYGVLVE